jgi:serine/threonine protein phosphatase PrpC
MVHYARVEGDDLDRRWGYGTEQRARDDNQDTHGVFAFDDFTLAVVCDGMGGHHGGAYASALAVRTIYDAMTELQHGMHVRDALVEAIKRANQAIYDASRRSHRLMGMGTTVAAVVITNDEAFVAHVGDSRVYIVHGGEAQQLTRDHTMVNLFVEAELLSPEDAASHPEAHVLSRSLGVERTVEVEVQEPIAIEYGDAFVVCSDGLHGVLTEWEFGRIDWADPQDGVWEALKIVDARQGDDNATAIALICGEFEGPGKPPTDPPEIQEVEDDQEEPSAPPPPAPAAFTPPQPQTPQPYTPPATPQPSGSMSSMSVVEIPATPSPAPPRSVGRTIVPQNEGGPAPVHTPAPPQPMPMQKSAPMERPHAPPPEPEKPKAAKGGSSKVVLALVAGVAFLGLAGIGLAALAMAMSKVASGPTQITPPLAVVEEPPIAQVAGTDPTVAPATSDTDAATPTADVAPATKPLFEVQVPEERRRPPHRPQKYLQPPPGGSDQLAAIQAARNHQCGQSLATIQAAMDKSTDHASLYPQAWNCFNDTDQRPLLQAKAETPEEFAVLLPHFRGTEHLDVEAPATAVPDWFAAPTGGIEYRLDAFSQSGDHDLFVDVMIDKLGEDQVADHLIRDVLIEATAAAGLSHLEKPTDEQEQWWARRVYYATAAMNGAVGDLIKQQRPEAVAGIDALIAEATRGIDPAMLLRPGSSVDLPAAVKDGWAVGLGIQAPPDEKPLPKPGSTTRPKTYSTPENGLPTETPPDAPLTPDGHPKVWRGNRP